MLSPNVVPGTKVVGVDKCPGPYSVVKPSWWWLLEQYLAAGNSAEHPHAGLEFTVLHVRLQPEANSGFSVAFLETGDLHWPLEGYNELQPRPVVRLERRVLEPA